jgi:hypothetical protein
MAQCVELGRANFETRISHFRPHGLKPGGFQAVGKLDSTWTSPPHLERARLQRGEEVLKRGLPLPGCQIG